jgi:hypothetical protein
MTTYRNTKFTKRNNDRTNIVFCTTRDKENIMRPGDWVECDAEDNKLDQLFMENDVRYFGFM